jgi:hypothetical protein
MAGFLRSKSSALARRRIYSRITPILHSNPSRLLEPPTSVIAVALGLPGRARAGNGAARAARPCRSPGSPSTNARESASRGPSPRQQPAPVSGAHPRGWRPQSRDARGCPAWPGAKWGGSGLAAGGPTARGIRRAGRPGAGGCSKRRRRGQPGRAPGRRNGRSR